MTDGPAPTVLVCDDTPAKRYVIASWLRRDGYTVLEAETGAQALAVVGSRPLDLAVLDVHLPDMTGLDVCAAIRAETRTAAIPVVHVSAVAVEPEDRSTGLDRGADAYLVDPIEPQELLATVRSLMRSSTARRGAERLAGRLDRLAAVSLRMNVASTATRVALAASEGTARLLDTEVVVVMVGDDAGPGTVTRAGAGGTSSSPLPASCATAARSLAGVSVLRPEEGAWAEVLPGSPGEPWVLHPLRSPEGVVGVVAVPADAAATDEDRMLVGRVTETASVALGNLRVYLEEHRMALTLQRSLLPASLPQLPGLAVAARYRASGEQLEVGGDFFDAFRTDDGRSVVAIGDVQGHSLEAAIVMAELRYSLRAFVHDGHSADQALVRLNEILLRGHPDLTATVCVLVFPPGGTTAEVANAGHIPPLLVRDRRATYQESTGTLLGVHPRQHRSHTLALRSGDRMVLMTDGLVERRSQAIGPALDRLAEQVAVSTADGELLCDELMQAWGDGEDDVCLVIVDILGEDAPFAATRPGYLA